MKHIRKASAVVATALLIGIAGPLSQAHAAKSYTAVVKCAKVKISNNNAVGFVDGKGKANTKPKAVAAAKKNANSKVGKGYRAKHCDVKSVK
ncbi:MULTISPECIES: hypothetical protein [unclassified Streptomyces]|uniref:hypothetical protein n=1 Tax=Streptomyces TaxID=1883 RepID=UPI000FD79753|nr:MULTISPECIES: hypothetical protein [unclassified Streptomyces]UQA36168.1 hypothetical protein KRR37_22510 [Streptomyces sp. HNA39]